MLEYSSQMMEKGCGCWNMLEQDFKTLEKTLEVVTGQNTMPCCCNRMLQVGTGLLHVGTEFLKLEQVGMGLYMLERNFHSWSRTTSIECDSFQNWKFTLKVGTAQNRNRHVGIQLIDDGKVIWKWEHVGTGL